MSNRFRTRVKTTADAGFTLIELLIVIVILGILAGIVTFGVAQFRSDSTAACTEANAKIVATANEAYKAKYPTAGTLSATQLKAAGYLNDDTTC